MQARQKIRSKWIAALLALFLILGAVSVGPVAMRAVAQEEGEEPAPEPAPTAPPKPTSPPPKPTEVPPTESPSPSPSPSPTPEPEPEPDNSSAPEKTDDPGTVPSASPAPGESVRPEASPTVKPDVPVDPENTPDAVSTPDPDATPDPEETPEPPLEDQSPDESNEDVNLVMRPKSRYSGWYGVVPSDERGMPIPMLFQYDYNEIVCTINGTPRSVATSGCGATSVSMVVAYLTGNTEQTPYTLFYHAVEMGRYSGSGLGHETLSWMLRENGVQSSWIANNGAAVLQALRSGKPVIAHMGPGIFTSQGHYIVLRGVTEDGKILVNDPNSASRSRNAYPVETFLTQAKDGASFLVCWVNTPKATAAPIAGDVNETVRQKLSLEDAKADDSAAKPRPAEDPAAEFEEEFEPDGRVPLGVPAIVAAANGKCLPVPETAAAPEPTPEPMPTFEVAVDATLAPPVQ